MKELNHCSSRCSGPFRDERDRPQLLTFLKSHDVGCESLR
jgi:hypothetical protein